MKRSFYELLGVPRDAPQDQIDTAYQLALKKLNTTNVRGIGAATTEEQMVIDGYQLLCDPVKRRKYDAQLAASESGVQLIFFPEDRAARHKLGLETIVLAALATVLGAVIYHQLSQKMDVVRVEHGQAVIKQQEEQQKVKVISVDTTQPAGAISGAAPENQKR